MKKTFRVYNECVTYVTVDIPEDMTIDEVDDMVRNEYYDNPMLRTEVIPDVTDIEFEDDGGEIFNLGEENTYENADIPFLKYFNK